MRNLFLTVAFIASIVALIACTKAQGDAAMRVLSMSAEECAKIALANGRRDIALACGVTDSALDVLSASLADQTCVIPTDAGGQ